MGMPSSRWDVLVRETSVAARRRRRRRLQQRMLWLLAVVTSAALVVIAVFIMDIAKVPTKVRPAALSASAQTLSHGTTRSSAKKAHRARARPSQTTYPQVADVTSGLSYRQFSAPWQQGCPSGLSTPMLDWTAGENTVAGHVSIGGSVIDWHGLACSGPLAQQFGYTGPAELEAAAASLLAAIDPAYYAGVRHSRTTEIDKATRVSGHQAWEIEFTMTYPDGASQGVTWRTELGAVVVADRGPDLPPAVFYVSVPATLGVPNVDVLIDSLSLSQQS
jgi:PAS domain-containing protein